MNATWDGSEPCPNPKPHGHKNRKRCGKDTRSYSCRTYPAWTPPPPKPTGSTTLPSSAVRMGGIVHDALLWSLVAFGVGIAFTMV